MISKATEGRRSVRARALLAVAGAGVAVAAGIAVAGPAAADMIGVATRGGSAQGSGDGSGTCGADASAESRAENRMQGRSGMDTAGRTGRAAEGRAGMGMGANGPGAGQGTGDCESCTAEPGSGDVADLGDVDAQDLVTWAEEEKVALDLYTAFAGRYDARQFERVAMAEAQHLEAVRTLLATYGLDDPTDGAAAGEFTDPAMQEMYDTLLAQGSASLDDAMAVGQAVERDDIALLESALEGDTAADVEQVLTRQLAASERHLAAFGG